MSITLNGGTGITTDIDGDESLTLNRDTSDGTIIDLQKDNTTVGAIGSNGGTASWIACPTGNGAGLRFDGGDNRIVPTEGDGTNRNASVDLGYPSSRFKDLYLSGGAYLGGTGSANYLDDYEEGTWTPGISAGTLTINTTFLASYTKIGNIVHAQCYMDLNSDGNTTGLVITGLPFNAVSNGYVSQIVNQGAYADTIFSRTQPGTNYLRFYVPPQSTVSQQTADGSHFIFATTYKTDS